MTEMWQIACTPCTKLRPHLRIVLDPGHRFHTVDQALALAREIETYDIVFEDPIPKDNIEDYRRLKDGHPFLLHPIFRIHVK